MIGDPDMSVGSPEDQAHEWELEIRADERERCAKIAREKVRGLVNCMSAGLADAVADEIADMIRASGKREDLAERAQDAGS